MGISVVANRNLKTILKDAMVYAVSDWRNFLILGLILVLTDHVTDLNLVYTINSISDILIIASIVGVITILSFIEIGYGFRIVEETVEGSTSPPGFHHPLNLFVHGIKESLILIVYFILPLILLIVGIFEFATFTNLDLGLFMEYALIIGLVIFFICFNIMMQGAILTMAHHDGSIRWGFNMPQVFAKIRKVGLKNMLLVTIITGIVFYIVKQLIFNALQGIPYLGSTVGQLIGTVLVAPFLMIFTTRLLGLIDVPYE